MKQGKTKVVLIGYRGSGKSVLSSHLAAKLNIESCDTDEIVKMNAGKSISEIFAEEGEKKFREMESEALKEALGGTARIIATGGGIVLSEENRKLINDKARVVFLYTSPEKAAERIERGTDRPSLSGGSMSLKDEVEKTFYERLPLYERLADLKIDTEENDIYRCEQIILRTNWL